MRLLRTLTSLFSFFAHPNALSTCMHQVKALLADPRLRDLESTEERASDAVQRAHAKPQQLEQAQKVVSVRCACMCPNVRSLKYSGSMI